MWVNPHSLVFCGSHSYAPGRCWSSFIAPFSGMCRGEISLGNANFFLMQELWLEESGWERPGGKKLKKKKAFYIKKMEKNFSIYYLCQTEQIGNKYWGQRGRGRERRGGACGNRSFGSPGTSGASASLHYLSLWPGGTNQWFLDAPDVFHKAGSLWRSL